MMKVLGMIRRSFLFLKRSAILMAAMLLVLECLPSAQAQGYWWPPPPDYYYQGYPQQYPQEQQRPRRRRESEKKKAKPKPTEKPKPAKPDKDDDKDEKKRDKEEKKSREPEKKQEEGAGSDRQASPAPQPEGVSDPADGESAPAGPEVPARDVPAVESANPYHGRPRLNGNGARPAASPTPELQRTPPPGVDLPNGEPLSRPAPPPQDGMVVVWDDSDSLPALARSAAMTPSELLESNKLTRAELREGQALRVPVSSDLNASGSGNGSLRALDPERQMAREVWRGIRGKKRVALTFDAGGEDDGINDLLDHLRDSQAKATFFVTGDFAKKNPKIMEEIAGGGFPIHNHSWSHPEFTKISEDKIRDELLRTDEVIEQATGKGTKPYWRPPFGDRDDRVLRAAAEAGFQSIYWTIDTLDSVGEKKDPDFVVNRVLNPAKASGDPDRYLDGAIILMHVGEPKTAEAVPQLVRALRERGFELVTVEEILKP